MCTAAEAQHGTVGIVTNAPALYEEWKHRVLGRLGTDDEVRNLVETERAVIAGKRDPFTPLAGLTCLQRSALNESVVWEDVSTMVIVDIYHSGPKLLVVPKTPGNFPTDFSMQEIERLGQVSAAACDSLVSVDGANVLAPAGMCHIYINPPAGLMLRQLHVHVQLAKSSAADYKALLHRVASEMRGRLGGNSCF